MKKMLRSVALPPTTDDTLKQAYAVISTLRAETYDEIHAIEPYTVEAAITALQDRATVDEANIATLQGQMTTAIGNISSLDGRVTVTEQELASLDVTFILAFIAYFISYQSNAAGDYHSNHAGDYRIHQRL
jgi:hypothetical protein